MAAEGGPRRASGATRSVDAGRTSGGAALSKDVAAATTTGEIEAWADGDRGVHSRATVDLVMGIRSGGRLPGGLNVTWVSGVRRCQIRPADGPNRRTRSPRAIEERRHDRRLARPGSLTGMGRTGVIAFDVAQV